MKIYTSKEMIKLLEADGWYLVRIRGGHHHYKHLDKKGKVTVPYHNKDLKKGLADSILEQAGLK
jgi:predicted RNA binding protein YcfA (HicA-like mRNA interferase family)